MLNGRDVRSLLRIRSGPLESFTPGTGGSHPKEGGMSNTAR